MEGGGERWQAAFKLRLECSCWRKAWAGREGGDADWRGAARGPSSLQ